MSHFGFQILTITVGFLVACTSSTKDKNETAPPNRWLQATELVDHDHPAILKLSKEIVAGGDSDRNKAIKIHNWVRDNIAFGFTKSFWKETASDVLQNRLGFCNTQSTLFVALLRAQGIPSRIQTVSMSQEILSGLLNTGSQFVDHSYSEVYIEGRWIKTDSYILDPELFKAAQTRLKNEKKLVGYGTVLGASNDWDGANDSFSQYFLETAPKSFIQKDFGTFGDIGQFYQLQKDSNNGGFFTRFFFRFVNASANRRIDAIRRDLENPQ